MKIEVRADDTVHVEGYVNVPGRDSRPLRDQQGIYIEQVTPGTFGKALASGNPVELRFNHRRTLGSTEDGTVVLREDSVGLYASAAVQDEELAEKARNKELRGWSFGFVKQADRWEGENPRRRFLDEIELREVSILDKTPAYIATSIETRGDEETLVEFRAEPEEPDYQVEEREARRSREQGAKTGAEARAQGRAAGPGWVLPQSEGLGPVAEASQRDTTVVDTTRKTLDPEGESLMRRVTQTIEFYKLKRRERHA